MRLAPTTRVQGRPRLLRGTGLGGRLVVVAGTAVSIHRLFDGLVPAELPHRQPGLVYFEPGSTVVPFEYHKDPGKTAATVNRAGWATVGDIGQVDDEGYLYLVDRQDFMIVSGGVNIYPQETEDVLTMHPKVKDVAVFGVPDADMGEAVQAVVEPADMQDAGPELEAELIEFCRQRLAHYKCPRSIDFSAGLPRYENGKMYKRLLRDRYWTGAQSRII